MSVVIRRSAGLYEEIQAAGPTVQVINSVMEEHSAGIERYNKLDDYYKGSHGILNRKPVSEDRTRPNIKMVHDYPKYVITIATGYLLGDIIKYIPKMPEKNIDELLRKIDYGGFSDSDEEIAKDMGIFGRGYELIYTKMDEDEKAAPISYVIDPRNSFIVYEDTAQCRKLFGVYYLPQYSLTGKIEGYACNIYTRDHLYTCTLDPSRKLIGQLKAPVKHYFTDVPLVEYLNNEEATGDFEGILSLIDAYNALQSDRMNDIERFVHAILFLKNFTLDQQDAAVLKEKRILQSLGGDNVDAKWLVNSLDQQGVEIIRKTIEQDIHKFSFVPAVTDEHFASNASGVAMKYKLIGLTQMNKIKKRYMTRGIEERLELILGLPNMQSDMKARDIKIEFTHSLPVNDAELINMAVEASGIVSRKTLYNTIPFIKDPAMEEDLFKQQRLEDIRLQAESFDMPSFERQED